MLKKIIAVFCLLACSMNLFSGSFVPKRDNGEIVLFNAEQDKISDIVNYTKRWIKGSDITPVATFMNNKGHKWVEITYTGSRGVGVSRFDVDSDKLNKMAETENFSGISLLLDNKSREKKTVQLMVMFTDKVSLITNISLKKGVHDYQITKGFIRGGKSVDWSKIKFIWLTSKNPRLAFSIQKITMIKELFKNIASSNWSNQTLKKGTDLSNDYVVSFVARLLKGSTVISLEKPMKEKEVTFSGDFTEDVILFTSAKNISPSATKSEAFVELVLKNRRTAKTTKQKLAGYYMKKGSVNIVFSQKADCCVLPFFIITSQHDFKQERQELNNTKKVLFPKPLGGNVVLDGTLDKNEWQSACQFKLYKPLAGQTATSDKQPKEKTDIYIARKGKNLYFGIKCAKIDGQKPVTNFTEGRPGIWKDECIEFYFTTNKFSRKIAQLIVNSKGAFYIVNQDDAISENIMPEVKTTVYPDKWELEAEIPMFQMLNQKCNVPAFNITRTTYKPDGKLNERSGWSTVKWNDTKGYGVIVMQDNQKKADADIISEMNNKCLLIADKKSSQQVAWEACVKPSLREHPAFVYPVIKPTLPNVLIVGDSVSMQYTPVVQKQLASKANVFRIPGNGGPVMRCFRNFNRWINTGKWDVIIFNFGLHDNKYQRWDRASGKKYSSPEKYGEQLAQMVDKLKQTKAKLIWVATTPIPAGAKGNDKGDSIVFNKVAEAIMKKKGIPIIDLYSFIYPKINTYHQPKNIHLSRKGADAAGKKISRIIETYLKN